MILKLYNINVLYMCNMCVCDLFVYMYACVFLWVYLFTYMHTKSHSQDLLYSLNGNLQVNIHMECLG